MLIEIPFQTYYLPVLDRMSLQLINRQLVSCKEPLLHRIHKNPLQNLEVTFFNSCFFYKVYVSQLWSQMKHETINCTRILILVQVHGSRQSISKTPQRTTDLSCHYSLNVGLIYTISTSHVNIDGATSLIFVRSADSDICKNLKPRSKIHYIL